jgi:hypothetical protein
MEDGLVVVDPWLDALGMLTRNVFTILTLVFAVLLLLPAMMKKPIPGAARISMYAVFLVIYLGCALAIVNTASHGGKLVHEFPMTLREIERAEPVYETFEGWQSDLTKVRSFDRLPEKARAFIARLGEVIGAPVSLVSVGPERSQSIVRPGSYLARALRLEGQRRLQHGDPDNGDQRCLSKRKVRTRWPKPSHCAGRRSSAPTRSHRRHTSSKASARWSRAATWSTASSSTWSAISPR